MPGCNPAFRPDKKLDVNKNRMLTIFITSLLTAPGCIIIAFNLNVAWCQVKPSQVRRGEQKSRPMGGFGIAGF
jgi:hypothetical protein